MHGKWFFHKLKKSFTDIPKKIHEKKRLYVKAHINNKDFTVISNNCWAGSLYRYLDIPYATPTVGLYFFADDYIKLIGNLRHYFNLKLQFISWEQSKHADEIKARGETHVPIARLDDIEVIFLHYKTEQEAEEKWERRKKRINYDNIILKFSQMNFCCEKQLKQFDEFPFEKKLVFVTEKKHGLKYGKYFSGYEGQKSIALDSRPFPKAVNVLKLINAPICKYTVQEDKRNNG